MEQGPVNQPGRTLGDFIGRWRLTRQIRHTGGAQAEFAGHAVWQPEAQELIYHETGLLQMPGSQPMQAERKYLWREGLCVYFDDGRFFHQVPARGGNAEHWCDPDTYSVRYDFADWPAFSTAWTVRGPRKDYEMSSQYERC
ncbi:hypothetical protein So717_40910 [Roseobacter cerasinus]|uniref:DUF6314 domain-containing protein n=1 Tax=Roseobacter cerasinus TaxID=2602289 RepID=A0A640VVA0_9RHOB|nr:hypothetical protein So717_40910 [Roseobacter cerasinus]